MSKIVQSEELLPFSLNGNPFIKASKGVLSLLSSVLHKLKNMSKNNSQEGGFLNFLRPLVTAGLPLMKYVLTPLAKNMLLPLGLSAGMSAADAVIQKKNNGLRTIVLITSNEKMEDIMKIV